MRSHRVSIADNTDSFYSPAALDRWKLAVPLLEYLQEENGLGDHISSATPAGKLPDRALLSAEPSLIARAGRVYFRRWAVIGDAAADSRPPHEPASVARDQGVFGRRRSLIRVLGETICLYIGVGRLLRSACP